MRKSDFEKPAAELATTEEILYNPPCPDDELDKISNRLKTSLPVELAELLRDTNGLKAYHSLSIWSAKEILETNETYWQEDFLPDLYMPFKALLFFADAGDGDSFAYRILENRILYHDIYLWNHENDSRFWVASSLRGFIKRSLNYEFD